MPAAELVVSGDDMRIQIIVATLQLVRTDGPMLEFPSRAAKPQPAETYY